MYYDLVASLPHLPYFERAERLPITRQRLDQRLRLLTPAHAGQLARAAALVRWRVRSLIGTTDAAQVAENSALMAMPLERPLREYAAFRMDQQTLLAALRRKLRGLGLPEGAGTEEGDSPHLCEAPFGPFRQMGTVPSFLPRVLHFRLHWDEPDFRLALLYPWLPKAKGLLAAGDARSLERLLMDVALRRLDRHAEQDMFGFEAVFSYCFKWDILRAWLACDAEKAKTRFRELIDQVTHVEHN